MKTRTHELLHERTPGDDLRRGRAVATWQYGTALAWPLVGLLLAEGNPAGVLMGCLPSLPWLLMAFVTGPRRRLSRAQQSRAHLFMGIFGVVQVGLFVYTLVGGPGTGFGALMFFYALLAVSCVVGSVVGPFAYWLVLRDGDPRTKDRSGSPAQAQPDVLRSRQRDPA